MFTSRQAGEFSGTQTSLGDLIEAMHAAVEPEDEDLVVTTVYVLSVVGELPMKVASTLLLRASGLFFGLVLYLLCLAAEIHFQRGGVL